MAHTQHAWGSLVLCAQVLLGFSLAELPGGRPIFRRRNS
jgi:hypothetical protein